MSPLDTSIWMCAILAYISVSIILYLICRFSPFEWHYDPKKNEKGMSNDFSILNTLWFNLAAVMQQGQ
jgi:glutamate receptor 1/glutamate receptor 2